MKKKLLALLLVLGLTVTLSTAAYAGSDDIIMIKLDGTSANAQAPETTQSAQTESSQPSQVTERMNTVLESATQAADQALSEKAAADQKAAEEAVAKEAEQGEIAPPYYIEVDCTNCITRVWCNQDPDTKEWKTLVRKMVCSTGRSGHATPKGTYSIYEHTDGGGPHPMVDGTYARWCMRWKSGGYMFHSVCYSSKKASEPIAQEVADLGTNVSRGCVRLSVTDAAWLYRTMPNGTTVHIY